MQNWILFSDADYNFAAMTYNVESVILIKWQVSGTRLIDKHESEKQIRDQS